MSLGVLMKDLADRGGAGWRERKRESGWRGEDGREGAMDIGRQS